MESDSTDKRQLLLDVALELFAIRGYDAVGVQEIVEGAGVTKPTLYHYFGSKEGLLETLLGDWFSRFCEGLSARAIYQPHPAHYELDVLPQLTNCAEYCFLFAARFVSFWRLQTTIMGAPPESAPARIAARWTERLLGILRAMFCDMAKIHGNLAGHENQLAWTFFGMVQSSIAWSWQGHMSLDNESARAMVRQFMQGIFS